MRQQAGVMADPVDTIKYYKKPDDWQTHPYGVYYSGYGGNSGRERISPILH